MEDHSLTQKAEHLFFSKFDRESTLSVARKLLYAPDYPDGILTFSDQIAISVMLTTEVQRH